MAVPVNGKDCILTAWNPARAAYEDIACGKSVDVTVNSEMGDATTADSGFWRTPKPTGLSDWSISMTGVLFLRDTVTNRLFIFDLITEQVRLEGLNIKVIYTDQSGFPLYFTGFVYIPSSVISGTAGQLAQWSVEFIGSGPLDLSGTLLTGAIPGEPFSDWWTTVPGETTISGLSAIHSYSLIGKTVLEVKREGIEHDLVTGAPAGRQARFTSGTGVVEFDTTIPFNPNETVFVIFK